MSVDAVNSSMAALNQVYQTTPQTEAATAEETGSRPVNIRDIVTLSPEARKALEFPWLLGDKPARPTTLALSIAHAAKELDTFGEKLRALMRDNGIDTSQPITLGHERGTGRLIVTNDHPDADKIEALLEDDPKLPNMYMGATRALEVVKHGAEHEKYAEAYERDPQAAAARYAYLFNGQFNATWDTSVTFSGGEYEVVYNRVSEP